ncbi:hypothetical protein M422DRAFT_782611 [Sphaerobolus stellatus SS14]|uniref:Unplaced genomic scaffold SPHSTscaffold_116, whole genome shotgun sequence n=1 Tax=Sphaerobolus stellatus (strain SS14) TaxID=990650 RepID=A0A0C9V0S9_SPHS4|nr:hypothetical protein M422DRAFT_782611 [Sphaerobolus stellatus SS14]
MRSSRITPDETPITDGTVYTNTVLSALNIRQMLRTTKPPENSKDAFSITMDHNGTMRAVNFATASASGTASANEVFCMDNLVSVKEEGSVVDIRPTKELSTEVSVDVA